MPKVESNKWVLPASIPFESLTRKDLEECVYWLLDAMGAKDLEWRIGGTGDGAADQGRDLEGRFYVPSADGEMESQKWWTECKGRSGTLEADAVKSAANNALAIEDLDFLVIATNTTFSNPTRDWIKEWQKKHPRPKVRLWDYSTLERLLSQHPVVVLRLFSQALSLEGQLKAVESRFWNKLEYSSPKVLSQIWAGRARLEFGPMETIALVANELAHGDIGQRPWAAYLNPDQQRSTLVLAIANIPYLVMRSEVAGEVEAPVVRTMAYLVLASLGKIPAKELADLIMQSISYGEKEPFPESVQDLLLTPIFDQLGAELQDVCSNDCQRILSLDRIALTESGDEVDTYWDRLEPSGRGDDEDKRHIHIEQFKAPCKVGFKLDDKNSCPLFELEASLDTVKELLAVFEKVVDFRRNEAIANKDS